ncbi:MAG: polyamine aminopropyltransferase [Proteobacteria bacterium]|nr:polyamine aminopropyltransferase [Pseudomonadota bacterium]
MELWFTEQEQEQIRTSWKAEEVLFRSQSEFQAVDVIQTKAYGRMLVLDGCVMLTDADEFVYHEMIAHVPALIHKNPKRVVVIGGGDGGTVRELLKHKGIEEIILCEIDGVVVDTCRKFFPKVAGCLDDKRVKVKIGDGIAYMKELNQEIDLAIIDSTDPIGPGEGLFSGEFYRSVAKALKPGGLMVAQSESPWYSNVILGRIHRNISAGFKHKRSYMGAIPTYPRGLWSWTMAGQDAFSPADFDRARFNEIATGLQYLSANMVASVFDIPPFFRAKLDVNE